jgi:hypothetical protein
MATFWRTKKETLDDPELVGGESLDGSSLPDEVPGYSWHHSKQHAFECLRWKGIRFAESLSKELQETLTRINQLCLSGGLAAEPEPTPPRCSLCGGVLRVNEAKAIFYCPAVGCPFTCETDLGLYARTCQDFPELVDPNKGD